MGNNGHLELNADTQLPCKPRLAIMGEFSAGKSTLTNLLIGSNPLPMQVTATQLPPVWLTYGDEGAFREDLDGNLTPLDMNNLSDAIPEETRVIRVSVKADILVLCDLIDMPGISDPNMSPELWQSVVDQADLIVWCSHATQAWRQSEAAFWSSLDRDIHRSSLLLLTRFDKLLSEPDRRRVLQRVQRETEGLFADCFAVSLTMAAAAEVHPDRWEESGVEPFLTRLAQLLEEVAAGRDASSAPASQRECPPVDGNSHLPFTAPMAAHEEGGSKLQVVPRRVVPRPTSGAPTRRPTRVAPGSIFGDA